MTEQSLENAESLAFALLRFETGAGNGAFATEEPGGTLGSDAFIFVPVERRVRSAEVVPYFASLPSPAILVPSSTKGMVALLLLSELGDDRRKWADHLFQQYRSALAEAAGYLV